MDLSEHLGALNEIVDRAAHHRPTADGNGPAMMQTIIEDIGVLAAATAALIEAMAAT